MERVDREEAYGTRDDESVDVSDDELIDDGDGDGEKGKVQQEDVDSEVNHPRKDHIWYYKIEAFINHVREINSDLIHVLGTCLSLDEMIIRFLG